MEKTSHYSLSTYDYDSSNLLIPENYGGISENDVKTAAQEAASQAVAKVVADAPEAYDTLKEVADWIASDDTKSAELTTKISQNSESIQNVSANLNDVVVNLSTNLANVSNNLATNITSVQNSLDAKIETVRKTADSAKQISDTAYKNDKHTRELVDKLANDKQDKGDYALNGTSYTKEESDEKYLSKNQDVSSLATKEELSAKANVSDVYSKEEAESTFATQTVVNEEIAARITDKTEFETKLAEKSDKTDTYSKQEIDNKGFLTEHQDISELATKTEVQDAANAAVAKIVDGANDSFDTLKEIADWIATDQTNSADLLTQINTNKSDISLLKTDKADASSVYTKEESDAKYLTEHQDITNLATKEDVNEKANSSEVKELITVDEATSREMSELKTRIELLEKTNTTMTYASSASDIENVLNDSATDKTSVDLVVTSSDALSALSSAKQDTIFKNIAIVGSETSGTIQVNAAENLVIDNFNFRGEKGDTNGKINYSGKNVTISNVTCDEETTVYNVFEGNQNTDNGDNASPTSRSHIETLNVSNVVINNTNIAHNIINVYTPAEGAVITIKDSKFNIDPSKTNVLRMSNYLNSKNVVITFKNVDWTYENAKNTSEEDFSYGGLMIYQPASNDNALSSDANLEALKTWKVVVDNCTYNGEKVTENNFAKHNQVIYTFNIANKNLVEDPVVNAYFTVEFK